IGRAERVFGQRVGSIATAVMLTERLLLVVLACVLCGQYAVSLGGGWMSKWSVTAQLSVQDLIGLGAIILIGLLWTRARLGLPLPSSAMSKCVWAGVLVILALSITGIITTIGHHIPLINPTLVPFSRGTLPQQSLQALIAIGLVLPVLGG